MGVVQAKFFESDATTQYIDRSYLADRDGKPHSEFFLICFTGSGDDQTIAFLSANDILNTCKEAQGENSGKYSLPYKTIFSERFVVTSKGKTLDRIEQTLQYADITSNRRFIWSGLTGGGVNPHTDPLFEEPIDNPTAAIPESFMEFKLMANSAMFEIEDVHRLLAKIVDSSDPENAISFFKKAMRSDYCNGVASFFQGSEYLEDAIRHHKEVHEELTKSGLMRPYLALQHAVREFVISEAIKEPRIPDGGIRLLTVTYDPITFAATKMQMLFEKKENVTRLEKNSQVVATEPGTITVCSGSNFLVTRWGRDAQVVDLPPEEHAKKCAWMVVRPLMDEVYVPRCRPPKPMEEERTRHLRMFGPVLRRNASPRNRRASEERTTETRHRHHTR